MGGLKQLEEPLPPSSVFARRFGGRFARLIFGVIDQARFANQITGIDKPPIPAIQRIVSIVAENEILSFGHDNLAVQHYAVADYNTRRRMQRVTLLGYRPVGVGETAVSEAA